MGDPVVTAGAVSKLDEEHYYESYPTQERKVIRVIKHEQFDQSTALNDVALLILEQPMNMTLPNVGLICLAEDSEDMDNDYCIVSGWGNTDKYSFRKFWIWAPIFWERFDNSKLDAVLRESELITWP